MLGSNGLYGLYSGVSSTGDVWLQAMRNNGVATTYNILLNPSGGSIGVGVAPTGKLHVYQNDTSTDGSTGITIEQDGTGDSAINWLLTGEYRWVTGVDNSDTNKFKIGRGVAWGTGTDITIDTAGLVGIGDTSPASLLTVGSGDLFQVDSSGDIIKIKNLTYSWPASHTTDGYLKNNGSGTLTWATVSATASAAGSTGQIQYNSGGSMAAEAALSWDATNDILGVATTSSAGILKVTYINSGGTGLAGDLAVPTTTYIGAGVTTASALSTSKTGADTYISSGGYGYDFGIGSGKNGGNAGNIYLAQGGVPDTDGTYGANGTVNVGSSAGTGGTLNIYADTLTKDAFTQVGADPMCWDGSGASSIGDCTSLRQYKTNIVDLELGLDEVLAMRPRTFDWLNDMGADNDLGFVAEEVEAVNPQLVRYNEGKLSGVKYERLTALLVNAIQEQQTQILNLESQIASSTVLSSLVTGGSITSAYWTLDETTGRIKPFALLDLNGQDIINIKSLASLSGKWSLSEAGVLEVEEVVTKRLTSKKGVTTEDKTTGEFYCIYVDGGQLKTEEGRCEDLVDIESEKVDEFVLPPEEESPELEPTTSTTTPIEEIQSPTEVAVGETVEDFPLEEEVPKPEVEAPPTPEPEAEILSVEEPTVDEPSPSI